MSAFSCVPGVSTHRSGCELNRSNFWHFCVFSRFRFLAENKSTLDIIDSAATTLFCTEVSHKQYSHVVGQLPLVLLDAYP
jgi:hypothetical protein